MTFQERYLLMLAENYKAKADAVIRITTAQQWLLEILGEIEELGFRIKTPASGGDFAICSRSPLLTVCSASIWVRKCAGMPGDEYQVELIPAGLAGSKLQFVGNVEGLGALRERIHHQIILWMIEKSEE